MRIISGTLKGRKLNFVKNSTTRPLKDSVRENIFNILTHSSHIKTKIINSNVLDLYSGIGSFGIECISRGAKKVTFIEQDKKASSVLRENLINLSILDKTKIFIDNIDNVLNKNINEKFHIFFFDPPFADPNFSKNIESINKKKIFEKDHLLIIHRELRTIDNIEGTLKIIDTKIYGRSKIIFCVFK